MSIRFFKSLPIIIYLLFQIPIKGDNTVENKYIFQILPSQKEEEPYLFYIQTINNLISINSTDEENCKLVRREIIDENLYNNISSVSLMDTHYLVKTCFGPDNIVEIQIKKNETYDY